MIYFYFQEEILRLRHAAGMAQGMPPAVTTKYSPAIPVNNFPMIYVAGAFVIALIGMIVGKFIL